MFSEMIHMPPRKPSKRARLVAGGCAGFCVLFAASSAHAYCRTTTCNAAEEVCTLDEDGCLIQGVPLFWPDLCATFSVHADGSKLRNISYTRANEVAERAFRSWISADCNGEHPYIGIVPKGKVFCDQLEFNHGGPSRDGAVANAQGPNANIIVFRDSEWPYNDESRTIALTTITFAKRTGEILDADIEVNSFGVELSTGDENVTSDLQSILAHEIGHFFGLAHSKDEKSTMNKDYDRGDKSFRSLSNDDVRGMCEIYPPVPGQVVTDCTGEGPRYGFSRYCGSTAQAGAGLNCSVPRAAVGAVLKSSEAASNGETTEDHDSSRAAWSAALLALTALVVSRRAARSKRAVRS